MKDRIEKIIYSFIEKKERDNIRFLNVSKENDICMSKMKYIQECLSNKDIEKMSRLDILGEDFSEIIVKGKPVSKNILERGAHAANFQVGKFKPSEYTEIVNIYLKAMEQINVKLVSAYNKINGIHRKMGGEKAVLLEQINNANMAIEILENVVKDRVISTEDLAVLRKCLVENNIMKLNDIYVLYKDIISNNMQIVIQSSKKKASTNMRMYVDKLDAEVVKLVNIPSQIDMVVENLSIVSINDKYNEYNKIEHLGRRYAIMLWDLKNNILPNIYKLEEDDVIHFYDELKKLEDDALLYRLDEEAKWEEEYESKDVKDYSLLNKYGYNDLVGKMNDLDSKSIELLNYANKSDKKYISEEISSMVKEMMQLKKKIMLKIKEYDGYLESYDKLRIDEYANEFNSLYARMMNFSITPIKEHSIESVSEVEQALAYFKGKANIIIPLGDDDKSYVEKDNEDSKNELINSTFIKKIDYVSSNRDVTNENNKAKSDIGSEEDKKKYRVKILPCGSRNLFYTKVPSNLGAFLGNGIDPNILLVYGICDSSITSSIANGSDDAYRRINRDNKKIDHLMDLFTKNVSDLTSDEKIEIISILTNSHRTLNRITHSNLEKVAK